MATIGQWQFWIDRGGTFTDIVARKPDGALLTAKLINADLTCPMASAVL